MRESDTYLAILDEGRDEGREEAMKKMILLQGQERFGSPEEATRAALSAISDLERLEHLALRLLDVSTWEELLQQPTAGEELTRLE